MHIMTSKRLDTSITGSKPLTFTEVNRDIPKDY